MASKNLLNIFPILIRGTDNTESHACWFWYNQFMT